MPRIKIKDLKPQEPATRRNLLEILAPHGIRITALHPTKDGIAAVTATEKEADLLLREEITNQLSSKDFIPMLTPRCTRKTKHHLPQGGLAHHDEHYK